MLELFIFVVVAGAVLLAAWLHGRPAAVVAKRLLSLHDARPAEDQTNAAPSATSRTNLTRLMLGGGVPCALLIAGAADVIPGIPALLLAMLVAGLGLVAPALYASSRARRVRAAILRSLPDMIDLLVICIEAGLGLNAAFQRVAGRIGETAPEVAEPFRQIHLEIRAGRSREDALRWMAERSGVDELRSLAVLLIQTDRLGTSVAEALRVHADSLRTRFHLQAEARAARASVQLAFPLVFCIFPALLAVVVGPAAVQLLSAIGGHP